jgi:hypothetical protein
MSRCIHSHIHIRCCAGGPGAAPPLLPSWAAPLNRRALVFGAAIAQTMRSAFAGRAQDGCMGVHEAGVCSETKTRQYNTIQYNGTVGREGRQAEGRDDDTCAAWNAAMPPRRQPSGWPTPNSINAVALFCHSFCLLTGRTRCFPIQPQIANIGYTHTIALDVYRPTQHPPTGHPASDRRPQTHTTTAQ